VPQDVLELADRLWRGDARIEDHHPLEHSGALVEVDDRVAFVPTFANVSAFATGDGLVLVDTGSPFVARQVHTQVRGWSTLPLHTAVYSHGHVDHVFGVPVFEEEARREGWSRPRVVAHRALPARFDRYVATAGYNALVNQRQFGFRELQWPTHYRYPDETYDEHATVVVGGTTLELHHARGETDDHTWTWMPQRRVLCCGDFFIWASPNAGNPQKVQRYPREWAAALREMVDLGPEILLPGHGYPVVGAQRVRQALTDTADLLDSLVEQTLTLMNEGARLDGVLHAVRAPAALLERPYLRPIYDEPEFVVRNVWRLYGGWWDGNPASLLPAPERALAAELARLSGGARSLAQRAGELLEGAPAARVPGEPLPGTDPQLAPPLALRLAGHLAELAVQADPDDLEVQRVHSEVFTRRARVASSTMARGVFTWSAAESARRAGPTP
jgi:glyoxylase-like metal-dependent hydrolase (beta-lactamase superfamily II)